LIIGAVLLGLLTARPTTAAPGDLYVVDDNAEPMCKFTPEGTKSTFASWLDNPADLAFDRTGNLFVAENETGSIFKFAPDGTKSTFASGLTSPAGLAFDVSGNLFVTDVVCGSDVGCGVIYKFGISPTKSTFATDTYNLANLAFDFGGNLFATIQAGRPILQVAFSLSIPPALRHPSSHQAGLGWPSMGVHLS
jgi:sugar lactone lactonase YvrE